MPTRPETIIRVRAKRAQVRKILRTLPNPGSNDGGITKLILLRMGLALLGRIRKAFIDKARGGSDEAGERWPKLSPKTIAYKRRHPGLPPQKARGQDRFRPSWILTKDQREDWWNIYRRGLARYHGDKSHAAALAWFLIKARGATTILEQYGDRQVEILRDTGLLLNSLSPALEADNATHVPPVPYQVFKVQRRDVIVGTRRKGALRHHLGMPGRVPQRRLWPRPHRWPASWWTDMTEQAKQGIIELILYLLKGRLE